MKQDIRKETKQVKLLLMSKDLTCLTCLTFQTIVTIGTTGYKFNRVVFKTDDWSLYIIREGDTHSKPFAVSVAKVTVITTLNGSGSIQ